jgi:hypothetical protein
MAKLCKMIRVLLPLSSRYCSRYVSLGNILYRRMYIYVHTYKKYQNVKIDQTMQEEIIFIHIHTCTQVEILDDPSDRA